MKYLRRFRLALHRLASADYEVDRCTMHPHDRDMMLAEMPDAGGAREDRCASILFGVEVAASKTVSPGWWHWQAYKAADVGGQQVRLRMLTPEPIFDDSPPRAEFFADMPIQIAERDARCEGIPQDILRLLMDSMKGKCE